MMVIGHIVFRIFLQDFDHLVEVYFFLVRQVQYTVIFAVFL